MMFTVSRNFCNKITSVGDFFLSSKHSLTSSIFLSKHSAFKELTFCNVNFVRNMCSVTGTEDRGNEFDYEAVTNGDKELEHKLKILLLEAEVLRQEGKLVPSNEFLKPEHWKEALNLSRHGRVRYFEYLFKIMKKKEHKKIKQVQKQKELEEARKIRALEDLKNETIEEFAIKYDLKHNSMFLRIRDSTMNKMYNNRLMQAIKYGQKLVIDCGYNENMTKRENALCSKQLMLLFAENRQHDDPFDLHLCNFDKSSFLYTQFLKFIPTLEEPDFPLNVHECSYLDVFPKDQLVYLTPHTKNEMLEYDHNAVYIVGGLVDKVNMEPLSLAKAKKEGLTMKKFPLDRYLQWGSGSGKSLTLNQVVSILNDVKMTGNWTHALRHVPKRKVVDFSIGRNLEKSGLSYDKSPQRTKWTPSSKIDFNNLRFNTGRKETNKERGARIEIKSIMND